MGLYRIYSISYTSRHRFTRAKARAQTNVVKTTECKFVTSQQRISTFSLLYAYMGYMYSVYQRATYIDFGDYLINVHLYTSYSHTVFFSSIYLAVVVFLLSLSSSDSIGSLSSERNFYRVRAATFTCRLSSARGSYIRAVDSLFSV